MISETPNSSVDNSNQDFNLLTQANAEFNNGAYDKCLETLDQLEAVSASSGSTNKLRHNRAVVQFYKSGCKEHAQLLKELNSLDLNEPQRAIVPLSGGAGGGVASVDSNPIARYNRAVIYFHRHMYLTAIETLMPVAKQLSSIEKETATRVGLLMLHLLLATNQLTRALAFLELLQTQLGLSVEALVATEEQGSSGGLSTEKCSRIFKQLSLLTQVLNRKVVVVPADDGSVELAALKAHQYYIMKDFQMAAKQLKKISAEVYIGDRSSDELDTCIANNMGVIHLRVRHYAIAARFFQNAIAFDKTIAAHLRTATLQQMSGARSCEILYNLGIAMLHLRRPKEAFQCLLVPLKSYHSNPRLWFRISEACIMDHEIKVLDEEKKSLQAIGVGGGARRKFIVKPTPRKMYSPGSQSAAVPEPNLEFAALSLRNALTLTTYYRNRFHESTNEEGSDEGAAAFESPQNWRRVRDNTFCSPSQPISKVSLDNMLSAIYAAYSYVSLRLGDYAMALEMAQNLLKAERQSDAHKMLAHMYAGEALIAMDKLAEARPHLEPTFVSSLNAFDFETQDWQVKSLDAAQNIVRYNLAVAMVLQGDYDVAKGLLSTCSHPIVTAKTISLQMYLELRVGHMT